MAWGRKVLEDSVSRPRVHLVVQPNLVEPRPLEQHHHLEVVLIRLHLDSGRLRLEQVPLLTRIKDFQHLLQVVLHPVSALRQIKVALVFLETSAIRGVQLSETSPIKAVHLDSAHLLRKEIRIREVRLLEAWQIRIVHQDSARLQPKEVQVSLEVQLAIKGILLALGAWLTKELQVVLAGTRLVSGAPATISLVQLDLVSSGVKAVHH